MIGYFKFLILISCAVSSCFCVEEDDLLQLSIKWNDITQKITKMFDELLQQQQANTNIDDNNQVKTVNIDIEVSSHETRDSSEETVFDFIEFLHNDTLTFLQSLLNKTSYNPSFRRKLLAVARTYHQNFQRFSNNALRDRSTPLKKKIISTILNTSIEMVHGLVWQAFNASEKTNMDGRRERINLSHDLHAIRMTNQDRVCEMFHVCPPKLGLKYFALRISTLLLDVDEDSGKLQNLWMSWLEIMSNIDYSGLVMSPESLNQLRNNIASRYTDSTLRIYEYLHNIQSYTKTGKPLQPNAKEPVERLRSYEKFCDELDDLMPGSKENWEVWNKLEKAIKEYLVGFKSDADLEFREFVSDIIDAAKSAKVVVRERFKHRLESLINGY